MSPQRSEKIREVEELAGRLIDGTCGADDHARLNSLLDGDPEACERYLNLLTVHAHLTGTARAGLPTPVPFAARGASIDQGGRWPRSARRLGWLSAAAVLVLGVLLATALLKGPGQPVAEQPAGTPTVATLVSADGVEWATTEPSPRVGQRVAPRSLALASGIAVLQFDNGAVLTLNGPAEAVVESDKVVELVSGRASARCPEQAVGFTVRTAASDFIDLGTEFGVAVNSDGSADVHVFEGVVIARPKASGLVVPVLHHESGRVEVERGDLVSIDSDPLRFPGIATRAARATQPADDDPATNHMTPIPADSRIVFLGDRATDRESHMLLINQSLQRYNGQKPSLFNASIQLPLSFTERRYQESVLAFKPTHAVLEFGPEIAIAQSPRSVEQFRDHLTRLVDRLQSDGIEVILSTGFPLGDSKVSSQPLLDGYNAFIRKLAEERSLRLADVDRRFQAVSPTGVQLVADRGQVPTFAGYRQIAAELLESFGYPDATVDESLAVVKLPGVIQTWHVRGKPEDERLTDGEAAALTPTESWRQLSLPQGEDRMLSRLADSSHSITYRDRQRGFATDVYFGKGSVLEGVSYVDSAADRDAFLNVGATVKTVWLNGERLYTNDGWRGWHAGNKRLPVHLKKGVNKIVIESQSSFFISITDNLDWPLP